MEGWRGQRSGPRGVVFRGEGATACARGASRDDRTGVRTPSTDRSRPMHSRAAEPGRRGSSIDHARARRRAVHIATSRPRAHCKKTLTAIPGKAEPSAGVGGPGSDTHLSNLLLELGEGGAIVLNDLSGEKRGGGSVSVSSRRQSRHARWLRLLARKLGLDDEVARKPDARRACDGASGVARGSNVNAPSCESQTSFLRLGGFCLARYKEGEGCGIGASFLSEFSEGKTREKMAIVTENPYVASYLFQISLYFVVFIRMYIRCSCVFIRSLIVITPSRALV